MFNSVVKIVCLFFLLKSEMFYCTPSLGHPEFCMAFLVTFFGHINAKLNYFIPNPIFYHIIIFIFYHSKTNIYVLLISMGT